MIAKNLTANALGSAWAALMSFAFVPVYLYYIGTEGYGLVGFFAVLTSFVAVLDGGIGAIVTRELAPLSGNATRLERIAAIETVRSVQWVVWALALIISVVLWMLAPILAGHWLRPDATTTADTIMALRLMSLAFLMQWPCSLYNGCLIAAQRQVVFNVLNGMLMTIRFGGAALVLWLISPTLEAFFIWQVIASFLSVGTLAIAVKREVAVSDLGLKPAWYSSERLTKSGRFASGVAGINVLALLLGQLDKVLLSALLPLAEFGVYSLASTMASVIYKFAAPIYNAVYPSFFRFAAAKEYDAMRSVFRKSSQLMALVIVPISVAIAFFSDDVLRLWTHSSDVAEQGRWVLSALTLGSMLNATIWLPYGLQLAHQWVRLSLVLSSACVAVMVPLLYLLTGRFGILGGAVGWLALNIVYVQIGASLSLRRLLPGELSVWYRRALVFPIVCSGLVCGLFIYIASLNSPHSSIGTIIYMCVAWVASATLTMLAMPTVRLEVSKRILKFSNRKTHKMRTNQKV